ncbi:MAG: Enamine/imine deaminase [Syntrophorhabdus sp. PtaU1.Bin153]|nr:MAG: Enamine/imine deaminase [Syntrophorhabdus sp. PtaU1.Bin153]
MKKSIGTGTAPEAIGPYSQAIKIESSEMLFCSGQIPLDPITGELHGQSVREQTGRVMENLMAIIDAAGFTAADIVKTTIYLTDLKAFQEMNAVYETFFADPFPARATVQVGALPRGALVEIDAIACRQT